MGDRPSCRRRDGARERGHECDGCVDRQGGPRRQEQAPRGEARRGSAPGDRCLHAQRLRRRASRAGMVLLPPLPLPVTESGTLPFPRLPNANPLGVEKNRCCDPLSVPRPCSPDWSRSPAERCRRLDLSPLQPIQRSSRSTEAVARMGTADHMVAVGPAVRPEATPGVTPVRRGGTSGRTAIGAGPTGRSAAGPHAHVASAAARGLATPVRSCRLVVIDGI
jgi:hypothetical protein